MRKRYNNTNNVVKLIFTNLNRLISLILIVKLCRNIAGFIDNELKALRSKLTFKKAGKYSITHYIKINLM